MNKEIKEKAKLTEEGRLAIKEIRKNNAYSVFCGVGSVVLSVLATAMVILSGYGIIEGIKGNPGPYGKVGNYCFGGIGLMIAALVFKVAKEEIDEIKTENKENKKLEEKIMKL